MTRSTPGVAVGAVVLLVAAAALSGCSPQPSGSPTPSHRSSSARATPSATPTPTAPPLAAGVLFRITVIATAPGGATARLTETVQVPVDATDTQSADEAQLDTECDSWRTAYSTTKYLVAQVVTTVLSGSWNSNDTVSADMASYPVWTGDQRPYQGYCANALPSIPGVARAVSPVGGSDSDSAGGWAIYRYGFAVPPDPAAGDTPSATDVVLSKCSVQLGPAASDSLFASTWPTTMETDNGLSCLVGGTS